MKKYIKLTAGSLLFIAGFIGIQGESATLLGQLLSFAISISALLAGAYLVKPFINEERI